ncbi:hypothetical protein GCM10011531_26200 [Aquaticitalea lipolytica]|jgi:hypothetical protein|uniref:Peptidylprolyl isomerase n=1 Tax=Aquaticitalea lipolytica TaxID=1247562 RepID=A0A8J2TU90_9FLAO|nr:hypothetical protein [Aquaticitalea lipolytica]GFZ92990.1 hypothetical protein GCM10011531_26200 [Aquaticitalea lipolytica]|tara:strand:- start:976 stop:1329 length:354 start_codon:yes stop_codon:yes gene_type:complete
MKKIITLCVFAFALVLGTQTMNGQTMVEINQAAFTKTQELKKIIKFDAETEEEVYLVYQAYESKMYNVNQSIANGDVISDEDKQKVESMLFKRFKKIFTEEQYELYLTTNNSISDDQ